MIKENLTVKLHKAGDHIWQLEQLHVHQNALARDKKRIGLP